MNQTRTPLLVGLAAATVLLLRGPGAPLPAPQPAGVTAAPVGAAATGGGRTETRAAPANKATRRHREREASRREYARLYREFLGIEPAPPAAAGTPSMQLRGKLAAQAVNLEISSQPKERPVDEHDLRQIAQRARCANYQLEFMIALVADPVDSRLASDFDLAMSALQRGLADAAHYRLDRLWLPWVEPDAVEEKRFRETAGMMLFRRAEKGQPGKGEPRRHLLAVLLVGETPKLGIHKQAFLRAVDFILDLQREVEGLQPASPPLPPEIEVLGPSYTGSFESLRIVLLHARQPSRFRIVSGSASGKWDEVSTEGKLGRLALFSRTLVPDEELAGKALRFLADEMGWHLDRTALLIENDTVYGRPFLEDENSIPPAVKRLSFPSSLFALRNAWEESSGFGPPAQAAAANPKAAAAARTALEVSLADQRTPVDVVPELSPLTSRIEDMAMSNLLRQIAHERIRYVGILATDVKDQLFIAEQVRRWAPNVIRFVFDGNLLYVHPQYNATMFGTLAISNFPLVPEGASSRLSPATSDRRVRQQFAGEWQEGIYLAVGRLLRRPSTPPPLPLEASPAVWIAASGNNGLWPLARLDADWTTEPAWQEQVQPLGPSAPEAGQGPESHNSAKPRNKADLPLLFWIGALCVASWLLRREAFSKARALGRMGVEIRARLLLSGAAALLCLAGAGAVGLWATNILASRQEGGGTEPLAWAFLALLLSGYAILVGFLVETARLHRWPWVFGAAFLVAGVLLVPWLAREVFKLWVWDENGTCSPGLWLDADVRLFSLRASALSGGMSPLVSLGWLAAGLFLWLAVEIKRHLVRVRHDTAWPLHNRPAAFLAGCQEDAWKIDRLLRHSLPPSPRWLALLLTVVGAPTAVLLYRVQPIGETRGYGCLFVVLTGVVIFMALACFVRFLVVWRLLHSMLQRVAQVALLEPLQRVGREVGWKPLQFSWYVPSYNALRQSVKRLVRLIPAPGPVQEELTNLIREIVAAMCQERFDEELDARDSLRTYLQVADTLVGLHYGPQNDEFLAARLIAYLRSIFNQLRYSIMGAMGTGLAAVIGIATYAFEPKKGTTLVLWAMLTAASVAAAAVFVQMNRDAVLSAIGDIDPGKVNYNWSFLSNVLTYAVLPVLGLIASQFPSMGRLLNGLLDPLARVLGSG
jgi:hypothetical protein